MSLRRPAACLAMLAASLLPATARSDGLYERRVIVQTANPASSTARRLSEELAEHGVEVVIAPPAPDDVDPLGPKGQARGGAALGVILLRSDESSAVVWVRHRATDDVTVREIVPDPGPRSSIDDAIAIGAREVVRAVLIERPRVPDARAEIALPQVTERPSSFPQVQLGGGFGAVLGGAGLRPVPQVSLDARLLANRWLGVRALTSLGLVPASVGDGVSWADVSASIFGGGVTLGDGWFRGPVRPSGGVGVLVARVEATGHTPVPFMVGHTEVAWVLAPYAAAGVSFPLTDWMAVRADGLLAFAPAAPSIVLSHVGVTRWGAPAVVGSLGLELALGL